MTAPAADEAVFTLADMFRETARMMLRYHDRACPDHATWKRKAALLYTTAARLDAGERVDTSAAYGVARDYLTEDTTIPPHMASKETSS